MRRQSSMPAGVGFFGLLGLLFIALKLTGHIDWSWWLVLLPIYGFLVVFFSVAFLLTVCLLILAIIEHLEK